MQYNTSLPSEIWNKALDYIYPPRCITCSELILDNSGFCDQCWGKLNFITEPFCKICSHSFSVYYGQGNNICAKCIQDRPHYDYARSLLRFDDASKEIIHSLKYFDQTFIAKIVAKMIVNQYGHDFAEAELIIPVPMHKLKRLSRLYNHAQILSEALGAKLEKKIHADILLKVRSTLPQTGLGKKQRIDNLSGSIAVLNKEKVRGKKVLLVDDVITTGSTINLCAEQLKRAGAKQVIAISIARTV